MASSIEERLTALEKHFGHRTEVLVAPAQSYDPATGIITPISASAPGDLIASAAPGARPDALLCDGGSYLASDYPALFTAIGITYGGDGTHFNVPNLTGMMLAGVGTQGHLLGETGGEATVTLTDAQMPVHSHGNWVAAEGQEHTHNVAGNTGNDIDQHWHSTTPIPIPPSGWGVWGWRPGSQAGAGITFGSGGGGSAFTTSSSTGGVEVNHRHVLNIQSGGRSATHNHQIPADGGGAAHDNMPPYFVVNWFIKT